MIRFNNDYNHAAHPRVLEALVAHNDEAYPGYGLDSWCERAAQMVKEACCCPGAAVHFMTGGTQTNYTLISHVLRPYQSVLSADCGHINVHETGAVEHVGHKVELLPSVNGKITAAQIHEAMRLFETSPVPEHITEPKMAYITFPTEYGTVYGLAELEEISRVCRAHGIYLFVDGARMSYGLAAEGGDVRLADLARLADAFYLGGTKCGALFGEAVVIVNEELKPSFRSSIKQNGGMLAKGWLTGLQFCALLENGLYFDIAEKAVSQAMRIRSAFAEAGVPAYIDSPTNQQFVVLSDAQAATLSKSFVFEDEGRTEDGRLIARFCTSWSTADEETDALVRAIEALPED